MIEKCKLNVRNVRFEPRSKMECTKSTPINLYYSVILLLYHSILIVSLCLFVETTLRFSAIVKTLKPDLRIFHRFASQKYHRQKRWYAIFKLSKCIVHVMWHTLVRSALLSCEVLCCTVL